MARSAGHSFRCPSAPFDTSLLQSLPSAGQRQAAESRSAAAAGASIWGGCYAPAMLVQLQYFFVLAAKNRSLHMAYILRQRGVRGRSHQKACQYMGSICSHTDFATPMYPKTLTHQLIQISHILHPCLHVRIAPSTLPTPSTPTQRPPCGRWMVSLIEAHLATVAHDFRRLTDAGPTGVKPLAPLSPIKKRDTRTAIRRIFGSSGSRSEMVLHVHVDC